MHEVALQDPDINFLNKHPEVELLDHTVILFLIVETSKYPSTDREVVVYTYSGTLLTLKKEDPGICNNN